MAETGRQLTSSGSLSDASDYPAKDEGGRGTSMRRSFECTYCKRGFTNAQALGGHMNLHRKDRAKAKQTTASSKKANIYSDYPNYMMMSYKQNAPYWEAQRMTSHHIHHPAMVSSGVLDLPVRGYPETIGSGHELGHNQPVGGYPGRIGSGSHYVAWNNNTTEDGNHEEDNNEVVDLELRLGPG